MTEVKHKNLDHSMARAIVWNATARWVSQLLSWVSTIVVARLLTPYDYGLVGMAGLYLNLASYVSQSGIGDAIIALRDLTKQQIAELNTLALVIGVGLVILSCGLAQPISHFFSSPPLMEVLLVSSIVYFFNSFQVVPRALLQKELRFKLIAGIETVRTFFQIAVTVIFACLKFRYWSLVFGYLAASACAGILTLYHKRHEFAFPRIRQLRRELTFSQQVTVSRVAWYAYENADFFVAGKMLGEVPLGNYTVAWNISSAPVEKMANVVTGVTPAYFSAVQTDKSELRRYLLRLTEIISFIAIPASVGLALAADYLVSSFLGSKWTGATAPLRLLGVFVAVRSISTFLPNLLTAVGDASFVMWATICSAIAMPIAFRIGSHWGTTGIAGAWLIAYPIVIAPVYHRVLRKAEISFGKYLRVILAPIGASALMSFAVLLVRTLLPLSFGPQISLAIVVAVGALSYSGALLSFHRKRVMEIIRLIRGLTRHKAPEAA